LEELLEAQARKLMLPILSAAAQCLASRQPFLCPICHRPLLAEAKNRRRTDLSSKTWMGLSGDLLI
jgi:hypothetical protein